jgi:hypothetical protein
MSCVRVECVNTEESVVSNYVISICRVLMLAEAIAELEGKTENSSRPSIESCCLIRGKD